jgi:hypothetical protein
VTARLHGGTVADLERLLRRTRRNSPFPHLDAIAPARMAIIRARARRSGIWQRLDTLDPSAPIPVLPRSAYREYRRSGGRDQWEALQGRRLARLREASLALWLKHPRADLDHLQDLLWAVCEDWTWVMPAHEKLAVDLGSAGLARILAEILHVHRTRLEPEVVARVVARIDERIWSPVADRRTPLWWRHGTTNWNLVCWDGFITSAITLIDDQRRLAGLMHPALRGIACGLDGFTADGGCHEGIDYWDYGFGSYLHTALALLRRSGGAIDLMRPAHCRRILDYPLACYLRSPVRAVFGDGRPGHLEAETALMAGAWQEADALLAYCRADPRGRLECRTMHALALADDRQLPIPPPVRDAVLPVLGQARIQSAAGARQTTLFVHAGDNGIPHNHNDLGSYILYRDDREVLADPGGPRYTATTFGPRRYDNVYCNAHGHAVPVIDGVAQEAGSRYRASLVTRLGATCKEVMVDLSNAYPRRAGIASYRRTFRLAVADGSVELIEDLALRHVPRSLEFRFISHAEVRRFGKRIRLGGPGDGLILAALTPGVFTIEHLQAEAAAEGKALAIRRITFTPQRPAASGSYHFTLRPVPGRRISP